MMKSFDIFHIFAQNIDSMYILLTLFYVYILGAHAQDCGAFCLQDNIFGLFPPLWAESFNFLFPILLFIVFFIKTAHL